MKKPDWVYVPLDRWHPAFDAERCARRVYPASLRGMIPMQCQRKPTTERDGLPVCHQHAETK